MPFETFVFDNFRLIPKQWLFYRDNEVIKLEPKVFDTLVLLVRQAGQTVSKDDLLQQIWPDTVANESSLSRNISILRDTLGDRPPYRYIKTKRNGGYSFCGAITTTLTEATGPATAETPVIASSSNETRRLYYFFAAFFIATLLITASIKIVRSFSSEHREFNLQRVTFNASEALILSSAIAPAGNLMAYAEEHQLLITDMKAVAQRSISLPPNVFVTRLEWFSDGIHLLVSSHDVESNEDLLSTVSIIDGSMQVVVHDASFGIPSRDALSVAFVRGGNQLWLANRDGTNSRKIASAPSSGSTLGAIRFSPDGHSILWCDTDYNNNHSTINSYNIDTKHTKSVFESTEPVADFMPLKGEELLLSRVASTTTIHSDIVISRSSAPVSPPVVDTLPGYIASSFAASKDLSSITFIQDHMQSDVYISELARDGSTISHIKRLTLNDSSDRPAAWLDNEMIIFYSDRNGHYGLYKQSINSSEAQVVVNDKHDAVWPAVSADKKWLFYFIVDNYKALDSPVTLMRQSLAGGKPVVIDTKPDLFRAMRCASSINQCVIAEHVGDQCTYYRFDPEKGRGQKITTIKWSPGISYYDWDLSPDGTSIGYLDSINEQNRIAVIHIQGDKVDVSSIHVNVRDPLRTLTWDAASKGFYVSTYDNNSQNFQLIHVLPDNQLEIMRRDASGNDGWAIPSPDATHLAFQKFTHNSNVWLMRRNP